MQYQGGGGGRRGNQGDSGGFGDDSGGTGGFGDSSGGGFSAPTDGGEEEW